MYTVKQVLETIDELLGIKSVKPNYEDIYDKVKKHYRVKFCNGGWVVERFSSLVYKWLPLDEDGSFCYKNKNVNFFRAEEVALSYMEEFIKKEATKTYRCKLADWKAQYPTEN